MFVTVFLDHSMHLIIIQKQMDDGANDGLDY